jgi:asparagine synthase (glutamine-hydrolysing)
LLAAYEKWGEDCPRLLLGEFSFAIWDNRQNRLFLCRDHFGLRPLLYYRKNSFLVFASDPRTLLAVPDIPRKLNQRKLAGTIVHLGYHLYEEETFHDGILSVPAASWVSADASGIQKRTYWAAEIRPEIVPRSDKEAFAALRELLFKAVDCRLSSDSTVITELSGGLDSSAIAGVAAKCLQKQGRSLLAVSAVLPENLRDCLTDEREYIDSFRSWPNIQIEYVTAPGRGPFDWIEDPSHFVVSPTQNSRAYLFDEFEAVAARHGAQVLLQGSSGEFGVTCRGDRYLVELALTLRWFTLGRELRNIAQLHQRSGIRFLAGRLRDLMPRSPDGETNLYALLTDQLRMQGKSLRPFHSSSPFQRQEQKAMLRRYPRSAALRTGQTPRGGVRVAKPLLDKRLVEFCLSAPPRMKFHNGYSRYLVRGALDGILPTRIQWRTDKKPFSPDYSVRYNAQLGKAKEFVAAIGRNDPVRSMIDVDRLEQLLRPLSPGVTSHAARVSVPVSIYTICFLRQFSEYRP